MALRMLDYGMDISQIAQLTGLISRKYQSSLSNDKQYDINKEEADYVVGFFCEYSRSYFGFYYSDLSGCHG